MTELSEMEKIIQYNKDLCREEGHKFYKEVRKDIEIIQGTKYVGIYCSNCNLFIKYDVPTEKELKKYNKK